MQGCRNVLLSGQKLKSFSDSSFLGPCIFFPCCLSLNSCLWLILCSALSKHFWVLGKLRNCSLSSNLCPFLSSFPRTPLLLNHLICIFTFLNGCQNVSSITGFTYMLFVLFPDVSLFFFCFLWFTCQDLSSGDNNFNLLSASFYCIVLPRTLGFSK